ncbi:atherin-like [Ahaetulla prasina]|uniref:atherin-like n=1 Tax=Ahaetulla prasina TaxID=499056 RepID=UPI0026495B57|nr:atherin-like [Ahaetulla prasina]
MVVVVGVSGVSAAGWCCHDARPAFPFFFFFFPRHPPRAPCRLSQARRLLSGTAGPSVRLARGLAAGRQCRSSAGRGRTAQEERPRLGSARLSGGRPAFLLSTQAGSEQARPPGRRPSRMGPFRARDRGEEEEEEAAAWGCSRPHPPSGISSGPRAWLACFPHEGKESLNCRSQRIWS